MGRKRQQPANTEVDAYIFIKENLRVLGWDTRNPERHPEGQVWTQNECLSNADLKPLLGLDRPENIVKVSEKAIWIIEAKRSHGEIEKALSEASGYASKLAKCKRFKSLFISGVAGNESDAFLVRTHYWHGGEFVPICMNGVEVTGFLSRDNCEQILTSNSPNLDNPPIDEKLFISRAQQINEILHLGAVNPHQRANVMAALLLSKLSSTGPNIEERSPTVLIGDINSRVKTVLANQQKPEFEEYIRIAMPASRDNHFKFRQALVDTIQQLDLLNIRSAMKSGADWLGAFYEVFLKYASWAQDLGIVLTPRHVTRFIADVMGIRHNDIVYDPTCGTGGFLVAAFDAVKQSASAAQVSTFKKNSIFGVEQDAGIAALAIVNMIFRGDGKNNIKEGNCFAQFLESAASGSVKTARYVAEQSANPPITKVMMNPPFALKRGSDKEYKFINHALKQMEDGGVLFTVLPYSSMVRPGEYKTWRKNELLPQHTLLSVLTFPGDVFYPVGVTSVGVFIQKGIPHRPDRNVLWIRAMSDGLMKSKGKRLPNPRAGNDLERVRNLLRSFLNNPSQSVESVDQLIKCSPIDFSDSHVELVPEAYLDQSAPAHQEILDGMKSAIRDLLAYLIKIEKVDLKPSLISAPPACNKRPTKWKRFVVTDFFELKRGHFHSIADLDAGKMPTISRVSTDNGLVGFFDKPEKARVWPSGILTVSTVTGDAFVQPVPFIATDNVVMCVPTEEHAEMAIETRFFIQLMINFVKWRYSYGRQCYMRKFAKTEIMLPVKNGGLDEEYMAQVLHASPHWPLIESVLSK